MSFQSTMEFLLSWRQLYSFLDILLPLFARLIESCEYAAVMSPQDAISPHQTHVKYVRVLMRGFLAQTEGMIL